MLERENTHTHIGRGKLNIHKSKADEKDEKFLYLFTSCDIARFKHGIVTTSSHKHRQQTKEQNKD